MHYSRECIPKIDDPKIGLKLYLSGLFGEVVLTTYEQLNMRMFSKVRDSFLLYDFSACWYQYHVKCSILVLIREALIKDLEIYIKKCNN